MACPRPGEVRLRKAVPSDAAEVARVYILAWRHAGVEMIGGSTADVQSLDLSDEVMTIQRNRFCAMIKNGERNVIVATTTLDQARKKSTNINCLGAESGGGVGAFQANGWGLNSSFVHLLQKNKDNRLSLQGIPEILQGCPGMPGSVRRLREGSLCSFFRPQVEGTQRRWKATGRVARATEDVAAPAGEAEAHPCDGAGMEKPWSWSPLCGFVSYGQSVTVKGFGEVHQLYIDPRWQRKGIGRSLIRAAAVALSQENGRRGAVFRRLKFIQYRTGVWKCHRSLSPDPSPSTA